MGTYLPPIEQPSGFITKLAYSLSKKGREALAGRQLKCGSFKSPCGGLTPLWYSLS